MDDSDDYYLGGSGGKKSKGNKQRRGPSNNKQQNISSLFASSYSSSSTSSSSSRLKSRFRFILYNTSQLNDTFPAEVLWKDTFRLELKLSKTELSRIACPICLSKPRMAVAAKCGHVFCSPCWLQYCDYQSISLSSRSHTTSTSAAQCPNCDEYSDVKPVTIISWSGAALNVKNNSEKDHIGPFLPIIDLIETQEEEIREEDDHLKTTRFDNYSVSSSSSSSSSSTSKSSSYTLPLASSIHLPPSIPNSTVSWALFRAVIIVPKNVNSSTSSSSSSSQSSSASMSEWQAIERENPFSTSLSTSAAEIVQQQQQQQQRKDRSSSVGSLPTTPMAGPVLLIKSGDTIEKSSDAAIFTRVSIESNKENIHSWLSEYICELNDMRKDILSVEEDADSTGVSELEFVGRLELLLL